MTLNLQEILGVLPHRYPMILVDRILNIAEDGATIKGLKNVTFNESFFQGHYPGFPVMPGVLIVEAMAQVGAVLTMQRDDARGRIPLIGAIDDVKFRRMVVPGDQLIIDCQLIWMRGSIGRIKGQASVEGELAASMELTFKLVEREF